MEDGGAIVRRRRRRRLATQMELIEKVNDYLEKRRRRKSQQKGRDKNGGSSKRMRKAQSEAEPFMSTLNYDELLEVFIRLPDSQSTMRCALVCKHWLSVISSTDFQTKKIKQHHESQSKFLPSTLIFQCGVEGDRRSKLHIDYQYFSKESQILHGITTDFSISYLNFLPWPDVQVFSSCHDLLLVSPNSETCWVICNPFTKQWLELPPPPEDYCNDGGHIQRFGWGGLVCKHLGFGFGRKLNEYKVILMRLLYKGHGYEHEHEDDTHVVVAYCSESKEWSKWIFRFDRARFWDYRHPFAPSDDGRIHWMMDGERRITVFEPFKDTDARIIQTPLGPRPPARPALVASVRGRLCLTQLRFQKISKLYALKVWELNVHGDSYSWDSYSWTLVKDIRFNVEPKLYIRLCILNLHPYNDNMVFLFDRDTYAIYEFYFEEEKLKKIGRLPPSPRKFPFMHLKTCHILAHPFWPTLLPI